ncbi:MAG: glycoside hydrolase, partial [Fimbriimonadales bacterium]|nr:glycoside hydrolase [Fimbriimonadales bacterium]
VFRSDPVLDAGPNGVIYYYSLKSDFYCDVFRTFDGGVTWQGPIPAIGGDKEWMIVDNTQSPGRGFMYVAWSTAGNNYGGRQFTRSTDGGNTFGGPWFLDPYQQVWGTLATNAEGDLFVSGLRGNNFYLSKSINAKFAAQTPTFDLNVQVNLGGTANVSGRSPNPGGLVGQVWVAVDKSGTPLHGNVYMLCSADPSGTDPLDVMFARSEDGGATWSAPVRVNNDPQGSGRWQWFGTMSVAPNGRIDVVWNDTRNTLQATRCQTFYAFSWDGGRTWSVNIPMTPIWDSTVGWPNQNKIGDYYHMVSDNVSAHLAYAATFNNEQDVYYLRITPPAPITPLEFSMFRGLVTGGGLSDLFASDNTYLTLRPGFVLNVNEAPIQIILKGQAGSTTAQQFGLLLERRSSVTNISENVQFFDFSTNQWVSMNTSATPTNDNILHVSTTTNPARFIHPTTREIRAKLEYRATGVVLTYPWFIFLDRVNWIIVP